MILEKVANLGLQTQWEALLERGTPPRVSQAGPSGKIADSPFSNAVPDRLPCLLMSRLPSNTLQDTRTTQLSFMRDLPMINKTGAPLEARARVGRM